MKIKIYTVIYLHSATLSTFKTSVVVTVSTWHIIPSVTMLGAKSVNTVFVFPVIRLLWGPEPETTYSFVCPHKGALHTSVIESNPRSLSVVAMLNVDIFFLIVNRYQIGTHCGTVWLSGQPRGACTTCEVAVATKITPSWLANICDKDIKRLCSLEIPTHLVPKRVPFLQAFPRLSRENETIEKREKWRPATRATGDEAASQTSFQLFMRGRYA